MQLVLRNSRCPCSLRALVPLRLGLCARRPHIALFMRSQHTCQCRELSLPVCLCSARFLCEKLFEIPIVCFSRVATSLSVSKAELSCVPLRRRVLVSSCVSAVLAFSICCNVVVIAKLESLSASQSSLSALVPLRLGLCALKLLRLALFTRSQRTCQRRELSLTVCLRPARFLCVKLFEVHPLPTFRGSRHTCQCQETSVPACFCAVGF